MTWWDFRGPMALEPPGRLPGVKVWRSASRKVRCIIRKQWRFLSEVLCNSSRCSLTHQDVCLFGHAIYAAVGVDENLVGGYGGEAVDADSPYLTDPVEGNQGDSSAEGGALSSEADCVRGRLSVFNVEDWPGFARCRLIQVRSGVASDGVCYAMLAQSHGDFECGQSRLKIHGSRAAGEACCPTCPLQEGGLFSRENMTRLIEKPEPGPALLPRDDIGGQADHQRRVNCEPCCSDSGNVDLTRESNRFT